MFRFKQFTIQDDQSSMKVGTDSILLGSWTDPKSADTILDVGTGSGVLALMMAQKSETAKITGVEVDGLSALQAEKNVAASPWQDQVEIIATALQKYRPAEKLDLIITNPPFFQSGPKSPRPARATARHRSQLTFTYLVAYAAKVLSESGRLCMIIPAESNTEVILHCHENGLFLLRSTTIHATTDKLAHRCLLEFGRTAQTQEASTLIIQDQNGTYTDDFKRITADFYLDL